MNRFLTTDCYWFSPVPRRRGDEPLNDKAAEIWAKPFPAGAGMNRQCAAWASLY